MRILPATIPATSKIGNGINANNITHQKECFLILVILDIFLNLFTIAPPSTPTMYPVSSPSDAPIAPTKITFKGLNTYEYSSTTRRLEDGKSTVEFITKQVSNNPNNVNGIHFCIKSFNFHAIKLTSKKSIRANTSPKTEPFLFILLCLCVLSWASFF